MNLFLLGATGSIGEQTLDIVRKSNGKFKVMTIAANKNIDKVIEIIEEFQPSFVSVGLKEAMDKLQKMYPKIKFGYGEEGLVRAATFGVITDDLVVNAIVGSAGLKPTYYAIKKGRNIALANKETLVIGGEIINKLLKKYHVRMVPIDSEHSAIMQCLKNEEQKTVKNIIITASGGSFRDKKRSELPGVDIRQLPYFGSMEQITDLLMTAAE